MRSIYRRSFTAIWAGKGEFYSNIERGEKVLVSHETTVYSSGYWQRASVHIAIQSLEEPGAWLSIDSGWDDLLELEPVGEIIVTDFDGDGSWGQPALVRRFVEKQVGKANGETLDRAAHDVILAPSQNL